ncbi:MAG: DUF6089 family protein [Ferruginibacter sp.]
MKIILIACLLGASFCTQAQSLHADLYAGAANYQGDLQGKKISFDNSGPALGLGLSYDITNKLIVRGAATYLKVKGSDNNSGSKGVPSRNLSFKTSVLEAQLALEYNLLDLSERSFTPYVFAGLAVFHFNPYAFDSSGSRVYLRSLGTEGQGLTAYPEKQLYKNNQLAIPFGGGLKLALSDNLQVEIEIGLRKLFTDYLDDVSGTYADSTLLANGRGTQAVAFAYRGSQIPGSPSYPGEGAIRGNPDKKDWYYVTGIRISYLLGSGAGNGRRGGGGKNKLGCPTRVY